MINRIFNWTIGSFFRTLGRFLFYIVVGSLIYFAILGFPKVHALTTISDKVSWDAASVTDVGGITIYGTKNLGKQWTYTSFSNSVSIAAPQMFNLSFDNKVNNNSYKYFYFYGISNLSFMTAVANDSACENISNSSSSNSFGAIENQMQTLIPFAFKCAYKPMVGKYYIGIMGNYTVNGSLAQAQPRIYNYNVVFYSDEGNSSSVESAITTQTNQLQLSLFGIQQSTTSVQQSIEVLEEALRNQNSDINKGNKELQDKIQSQIDSDKQNTQDIIDNQDKNHQETMDTITDSGTSDAEDKSSSFFENFKDNDHGLSGIITTPLNLIKSITSTSCSPLRIPIPFVDTEVTLPCMNTIYTQFFGDILSIYQTITTGMIAYWICIKIFAMVKGFKDPESDNVEVLEL